MKVTDAQLFRRALSGDINLDEVNAAFAVKNWPEDGSGSSWMMDWWAYCLVKEESDIPELDWKGFQRSLFRYSIRDRKDIVRLMAGHINRLQLPQHG